MKKMIRRAYRFWKICSIVFLFSCNQKNSGSAENKLLDQTGLDSTVRPQDDFFHYVNGGWIKKTDIPASEATWGAGALLYQNTTQNLKNLIDSCAKLNAAKGTNEQKVGDFYTSAMDSAGIEKKGFLLWRQIYGALLRFNHQKIFYTRWHWNTILASVLL